MESSIYAFETSYLSDNLIPTSSSSQFGNIIKGYDAFLKAPTTATERKRGRNGLEEVREGERIFSKSSSTYQKVSHFLRLRSTSHRGRGGDPVLTWTVTKAVETRELIPNRVVQQQVMAAEASDSEEEFESRGRRRRKTQGN